MSHVVIRRHCLPLQQRQPQMDQLGPYELVSCETEPISGDLSFRISSIASAMQSCPTMATCLSRFCSRTASTAPNPLESVAAAIKIFFPWDVVAENPRLASCSGLASHAHRSAQTPLQATPDASPHAFERAGNPALHQLPCLRQIEPDHPINLPLPVCRRMAAMSRPLRSPPDSYPRQSTSHEDEEYRSQSEECLRRRSCQPIIGATSCST